MTLYQPIPGKGPRQARSSAFTLIEMLVVIGVIGILIGVIGLSLGGGNKGVAMQNSQGTLLSALSGARAKAALYQASSAIFVNATPGNDGFMREFRIATSTDHDNNASTQAVWVAKGEVIPLSEGVYLVPPAAAFPTTVIDFQPATADWTDAHSTSYNAADIILYAADGTTRIDEVDYNRLIILTERGTTANAGRVVLAPARVAPGGTGLVFDQVEALRGVRVSSYGVATLVEGLESFK
jgi:prepilin-type N-terminal cleavage/methylation domain-containing protein